MISKLNEEELLEFGKKIKRKYWKLWGDIDGQIKEKFSNINGKTSQYGVPDVLFQKRTSRTNRVLIPWKTIVQNNITYEQLETFYGGVCVEFVNDDIFNPNFSKNNTHKLLKNKIGSNDPISSIITFRTEDGDSGATISRSSFLKFKEIVGEKEFSKIYKPISRNNNVPYKGKGDNIVWEGNVYYSIKGGSQNSIESHNNVKDQCLFNPAIDYANEQVCLDIDILMSFFAIHCFDIQKNLVGDFELLKSETVNYLKSRTYDEGNLYEYCIAHPTLKYGNGYLVDPIRLFKMSINNFKSSGLENSSVICHNEAANKNLFYFDSRQNFILTPARPTNFFWSTHLSNMMQQNYTLQEYYLEEDKRSEVRKKLQAND